MWNEYLTEDIQAQLQNNAYGGARVFSSCDPCFCAQPGQTLPPFVQQNSALTVGPPSLFYQVCAAFSPSGNMRDHVGCGAHIYTVALAPGSEHVRAPGICTINVYQRTLRSLLNPRQHRSKVARWLGRHAR